MLRKRFGTSALAVVALGLGIGLTTTMFSIVNGAILRGLPFEESDRILHLGRVNPTVSDDDFEVSQHDFADWRDRQQVFSDFAAFSPEQVIVSGAGVNADRYRGVRMSASTFRLLRVAPVRGRDFNAADERPGAPAVAVISYRVWESQFQSNPAAVGAAIRVNGVPTEIVGVMPSRFAFPVSQDVWLPLNLAPSAKRGEGRTLEVIGRLKPGVSASRARTEMAAIAAQLEAQHPENKNITVQIKSYVEEFIGGDVIATLYTMLGAVFGVLLIACANVTNLQLARGLERAREVAIRSAIGAERWRIVRQLIVEGALLAVLGSVLGVALAEIGVTLFNLGIADTNPPFWIDIRVDGRVLGFVAALAATAALLSSVMPALRVTRGGAGELLKDQGRGATGLRVGVLSRVLVGGAVTLSCALLLVSGLMIKSVIEVGRVNYSFAIDGILLGRTTLEENRYPNDAAILEAIDQLGSRLRAIPGVSGVALASAEPGQGGTYYLTKEGQTFAKPEDQPAVRRIEVTPSYFDVFKLRASAGRALESGDRTGGLAVTVITQDFADRYFPQSNPIGQRIRLGRNPAWPWWTIVGVVPKLASSAGDATTETAFVPLAQATNRGLVMALAAGESPAAAAPGLRQAARAVNPDLPVYNVETLSGILRRRGWPFRVFGTLFMSFGISALVMSAAGLYGVLAFGVRLRTREIGVRMALGAERRQVVRMIMRQGMFVVGVGLVAGLTLGYFAGPLMGELFFNVTPTDPTVFATTTGLLLLTGIAASLVPARRAASVDPLVALRED